MSLLVPPDATEVVAGLLREALPGLDERLVVGLQVSTGLGEHPAPPSLPWLVVREDGSSWRWPGPQRSTVRLTAWHDTEYQTKRLCTVALSVLVAACDAPGVIGVEPIGGAEVGPDPYTGGPVATASAAVFTRARPEF